MGFGDAFAYQKPADIFAEYVALDAALSDFPRDLDLRIFSDADYAMVTPTQWPGNGHRFFSDGQFFHPDGKARMIPVTAPKMMQPRFSLNTGRNRDQWHTMTRTGISARLGAHLAEPYVEIHPADAVELGATHGSIVELETRHGRVLLRALVTDRTAQGQLFAPMHWTRQRTTMGTVNSLTAPEVDPVSGQPALKSGTVTAEIYQAEWYGFLACRAQPTPQAPYSAVARTATGWQVELAGNEVPGDWQIEALALAGVEKEDAEACTQTDPASGTTRVALVKDGEIEALLFTAPRPIVLARNAIVDLIGTETPPLAALAGRAAANFPDPGPTICACFNVGRNTLLSAVGAGATSVATLGEATCAGTNCGSCKPELKTLITEASILMAAE